MSYECTREDMIGARREPAERVREEPLCFEIGEDSSSAKLFSRLAELTIGPRRGCRLGQILRQVLLYGSVIKATS